MTKPLLDTLVDRFLACPLPVSVAADPCATKPGPHRYGTSLLNVTEAREVLAAMLGGTPTLTQAASDVLAERQRQTEAEGWTPEHDDEHRSFQMAEAAACYADAAAYANLYGEAPARPSDDWPWDWKWWKPASPRRMLVKAGALILAEIERIDRIAQKN